MPFYLDELEKTINFAVGYTGSSAGNGMGITPTIGDFGRKASGFIEDYYIEELPDKIRRHIEYGHSDDILVTDE